jgi:hypothetical protein
LTSHFTPPSLPIGFESFSENGMLLKTTDCCNVNRGCDCYLGRILMGGVGLGDMDELGRLILRMKIDRTSYFVQEHIDGGSRIKSNVWVNKKKTECKKITLLKR